MPVKNRLVGTGWCRVQPAKPVGFTGLSVQILTNRINAGHSKHFNVKLRYINYLVEQKLIQVAFFKREFNTADLLTHALARPGFEMMLSKMHQGNTENLFLVASRFGGDLRYESGMTVCINFILK